MRQLPNTIVTTRASNVGTQLRAIRLAKNLTQRQMAKRLGVKQGWLSRVECGRFSLDNQPTLVTTLFSRV